MQLIKLALLATVSLACTPCCESKHSNPSSNSTNCQVKAGPLTLNGNCEDSKIDKYLGVPYAQPPIKNLRWEMPKEIEKEQTIDVTKKSKSCPAISNFTPSGEDCLYLNIYSPKESLNKPVMFWIHGGSFVKGTGNEDQLDGTTLAEKEDIIVVSINYRLGALGWFNGENYGMADVIAALKWVNENIEKFGGDRSKITIAGQSSGATLVKLLLNAQKAQGLFNQGIIMSDPATYPAYNTPIYQAISGQFAKQVNCTSPTNLECLRKLSVETVIANQNQSAPNMAYAYGPAIDNNNNELIPQDTHAALESGSRVSTKVNLLVGTVNDEGGRALFQSISSFTNMSNENALDESVTSFVRGVLYNMGIKEPTFFPTTWATVDNANNIVQLGVDFVTRYIFQCPTWTQVDQTVDHNLANKVYLYKTNLGIHNPHNDDVLDYCDPSKPSIVCHEDDIIPLFGTFDKSKISKDQQSLSNEIQKRWSQFIKYGDPNANGYQQWNPYSKSSMNLLMLSENSTVSQSEDLVQCKLIEKTIPPMYDNKNLTDQ